MVSLELQASPMSDDADVTLYPLPAAEYYARLLLSAATRLMVQNAMSVSLLKGKKEYIICNIKKTWLWYIWGQMWCEICSRDLVELSHILAVYVKTIAYARIEQIRVATE